MKQGYVVYDPPGDGNCQFSALCFALRNIGSHRSPETLRREIVQYLKSNDMANGIPLAFFCRGSRETIPSRDANGWYLL